MTTLNKYVFIDADSIPFLEGEKEFALESCTLLSHHDDNSKAPPMMVDRYNHMQSIHDRDDLANEKENLKNEIISLCKEENKSLALELLIMFEEKVIGSSMPRG